MPDPAAEVAAARDDRRARPWLRGLVALLLLVAAVLAWRWMMSTAPTHAPRPAVEKAEPVRTMTARLGSARPRWIVYGRAVAPRRVVMRPAVSGTVVKTREGLRDGLRVTAGDELLRIDDTTYLAAVREAEASLAEARAARDELAAQRRLEETSLKAAETELRIAERDLERARRLVAKGILPATALEEREIRANTARVALEKARATLAGLDARLRQRQAAIDRLEWALRKARQNLKDTVVRAPLSGVLVDVAVERGQQVSTADRLFAILEDGPREISLALSERRYGSLRAAGERLLGREATVIWATARGRLKLPARIVRVTPAVESGKGVVMLHARILDEEKARWLPDGAFVEVRLPGPRYDDVAVLPETAVYDRARVFVVREGRMRPVSVKVLGHVEDGVIVRGLAGGEQVIVSRMAEPVPGRKVKVLNP